MPIFGMRGTGEWTTGQQPEDWREMIMYLYPNGDAPLTAIQGMMDAERTYDPVFHWFTKLLPSMGGDVTNVYTDAAMSSAYTTGGVEDDVLYVVLAEAVASEFRYGDEVSLQDKSDPLNAVGAKVLDRVLGGAASYLKVRLLEDDDNSGSSDLSDCDFIMRIGDINPEGGARPQGISYNPNEYSNQTQIARTPFSLTRTARQTRLRTGPAYERMQEEAIEMHSVLEERRLVWGVKSTKIGDNGEPERTTSGLMETLRGADSGANLVDFRTDADYSTDSWVSGGDSWISKIINQVLKYGSDERLVLCGPKVLNALDVLAKSNGTINLETRQMDYGLRVQEWTTHAGTLYFKKHPLFAEMATTQDLALFVSPENMVRRYVQDTIHKKADDETEVSTSVGIDGKEEEFLTEDGYEYHFPLTFMAAWGWGTDNA